MFNFVEFSYYLGSIVIFDLRVVVFLEFGFIEGEVEEDIVIVI